METQSILLGLQFFVPYFFGPNEQIPAAATIMLLLLGFHWWALWNNSSFGWFRARGKTPEMVVALSNLLAILLAFVLLIPANMALLNDRGMLILLLILIGYAWKRGQRYTQADTDEEQFARAFKIGFSTLLVVMVFAQVDLIGNTAALNGALLRGLPIFFLSGMLTLSFLRLNTFKKEQARNPSSLRKADTNTWAVVLTVTWGTLVTLSIALEGLSLSVLQTLFSPLWYLLGLLASLILAALEFIANLLFAGLPASLPFPPKPQLPRQSEQQIIQPASNQAITMHLQTIIEIILIVLVLLVILRLIIKSRKRVVLTDEEKELREDLDRDAILKKRRAERKAHQKPLPLEPLEPLSARALYREFLIAMAEQGEQLQRRANETPGEYKKRLLALARHLPAAEDQSAPPDLAVLEELTQAYAHERYGGQLLTSERQGYLRQWVPGLAQRFAQHSKRLGE
jgi:Ca2+/Na+ antiporter